MEATRFEASVFEQLEAAQARIQMLETDLNQLLGIQPDYMPVFATREPLNAVDAVLESAPIAIYTVDWNGMISFAQGRAFATIGVRTEQLLGMNIFTLFHEESHVVEAHQQALDGTAARYSTRVAGRMFDAWLTPVGGGAVGVVIETTPQ